MNVQRLSVVAVTVLLACHDGATTPPPAPNNPEGPPPLTTLRLTISGSTPVMRLGSTQTLLARKLLSNGSLIPVSAAWTSSNPSVLTIDANGLASAVGIGQTAVTANVDGLSALQTISVVQPIATGKSDALIVEDFSMIEYQNPPEGGIWWYAPQLRVRAAQDRSVTILMIDFSIPGLGSIPPWNCVAAIRSVGSSDLNGESYGDWTLSIGGNGRAASNDVTATIVFADDSAVVATRTVKGPIVPGGMPETTTFGQNGGACYYGLRPPG